MSAYNPRKTAMLTSILVSTVLLTACGSGAGDGGVFAPGAANEDLTPETDAMVEVSQPDVEAPVAPSTDEQTTSEPVPDTEIIVQGESGAEETPNVNLEIIPDAEPEPEVIPEQEPEPEVIPEHEPETEPEIIIDVIPTPPVDSTPLPEVVVEDVPPPSSSCTGAAAKVKDSTLYLINEARAAARMCGDTHFSATDAVIWSNTLQAAAQVHSEDMAQHNFFSHTGSDGSSSAQRATNQGYNWRTVGENIAAGQPTTASVIDAWLESPGHCANLMNPNFEEVAVVCVENNSSDYRQYWTNALGTTF